MNWIDFYRLVKTLHIVGFVAWFAGLFYFVRMFVHHVESLQKPEPDRSVLHAQFVKMEELVYRIIVRRAMELTWTFGLIMLALNSYFIGTAWWVTNGWIYPKLILLVLLVVYQIWCKRIMLQLRATEQSPFSSFQFRLANELPTVFLLAIVLLAVFRNTLNVLYAFVGLLAFGVLLFLLAKAFKRKRESTVPPASERKSV